MAAEVPMACRIPTLHQSMKGTDSEPPPIATSAEIAPMKSPAALVPARPGNSRAGFGLALYNI
jgi:hypothetical protein